jgi:ankyrin repeat protein
VQELLAADPHAAFKKNLEGYLPLHSAGQNFCLKVFYLTGITLLHVNNLCIRCVVLCSVQVVQTVLEANPAAIQQTDAEGGLPIHHAANFNGNVEVLRYLHSAYPEGLTMAQPNGLTTVHLAASQNSSVAVLLYLIEAFPQAVLMQDLAGWLPLHCLLANKDMAESRVHCLQTLVAAMKKSVSASAPVPAPSEAHTNGNGEVATVEHSNLSSSTEANATIVIGNTEKKV